VTYLLLATLIGPVLGQLGVVPLAAHLFIFYFGMMAMVTPPVALAAYAAASIAGADIMKTGIAAFRFALVGFTLPFIFVFRPELLLLAPDGAPALRRRAPGRGDHRSPGAVALDRIAHGVRFPPDPSARSRPTTDGQNAHGMIWNCRVTMRRWLSPWR
jgi:hypothetical protein